MRSRLVLCIILAFVVIAMRGAARESAKDVIAAGETKTYTVAEQSFSVTLDSLSSESSSFTVNGRAYRGLRSGATVSVGTSAWLGVKEILYQGYAGGVTSVEFWLEADPLPPPPPPPPPTAPEVSPVRQTPSPLATAGLCLTNDDCSLGYRCMGTKCQLREGDWWIPDDAQGLKLNTRLADDREIVAEQFTVKGNATRLQVYHLSHEMRVRDVSWSYVTVEVDGALNWTLYPSVQEATVRGHSRYLNYTFDDGSYLYAVDVAVSQHPSVRSGATLRLAVPFIEGEYRNWLTYNRTEGPCQIVYDCPKGWRCERGACIISCGNNVCDARERQTCWVDCSNRCGDAQCSEGEGCSTCPADCLCSDGERCQENTCAAYCGNGRCDAEENAYCARDCPIMILNRSGRTTEVELADGYFSVDSVTVTSPYEIQLSEGNLFVRNLTEGAAALQLRVLPDEISSIVQGNISSIVLEMDEQGPRYKVYVERSVKLFGIITRSAELTVEVNALSGDTIRQSGPWWIRFAARRSP